MTIKEMQDLYIRDFKGCKDWSDRYAYIIALAGAMDSMGGNQKAEENLIAECQSRTWLSHTCSDGKLYFQTDSDALIVKGVLGMIADILSGRSPAEIAEADIYILDMIESESYIPQSRSNGIRGSAEKMISIAKSYL